MAVMENTKRQDGKKDRSRNQMAVVENSKRQDGKKDRSRNQMAVMENSKRQDGKKDRSKIVKTLEPLQGIADNHMLPLESLAGMQTITGLVDKRLLNSA